MIIIQEGKSISNPFGAPCFCNPICSPICGCITLAICISEKMEQ